jgi:hypothetical protein
VPAGGVLVRWAALALALALAGPVQAQSYGCCGFHDWATYGSDNLLRYHPTAHGLGGVGMDLFARGPWFAEPVRNRMWKRLVIVGVLGAAWQVNNLKEIPGYRVDYAVFDITTNLLAATLTELVVPVRRKP